MATPIRTHRELLIWQRGIALTDCIEALARKLPSVERFTLADQMIRAVRSIPTNIAEGHGRYTTGEFRRFLTIAHGSLSELDTHLEIAFRRGYLTAEARAPIDQEVAEIGRMIRAFRARLRSN
jgi:four helix bundle protein